MLRFLKWFDEVIFEFQIGLCIIFLAFSGLETVLAPFKKSGRIFFQSFSSSILLLA
jgi:hypothetical protein